MTNKEINHTFCRAIDELGKIVDEIKDDDIKNEIWDKWGEVESLITNKLNIKV